MNKNKNQNISISTLTQCSLFSGLTEQYLISILKLFLIRKVTKGKLIISEEDDSKSIYIIQSGIVKVSKFSDQGKELILAFLGQADIFGEMSLFDGEKRSTNVVAKTDCNLFEIRSYDFFDIIDHLDLHVFEEVDLESVPAGPYKTEVA